VLRSERRQTLAPDYHHTSGGRGRQTSEEGKRSSTTTMGIKIYIGGEEENAVHFRRGKKGGGESACYCFLRFTFIVRKGKLPFLGEKLGTWSCPLSSPAGGKRGEGAPLYSLQEKRRKKASFPLGVAVNLEGKSHCLICWGEILLPVPVIVRRRKGREFSSRKKSGTSIL